MHRTELGDATYQSYARRMRLVDKDARSSRALHLFYLFGSTACGDCSLSSSVSSSRRLGNSRQCAKHIRGTIFLIFPDLLQSAFLLPSPYTAVNLRLKCERSVLITPLSRFSSLSLRMSTLYVFLPRMSRMPRFPQLAYNSILLSA